MKLGHIWKHTSENSANVFWMLCCDESKHTTVTRYEIDLQTNSLHEQSKCQIKYFKAVSHLRTIYCNCNIN